MTAKELNIIDNNEYQQWLQQLCTEIDKQRLKAAMQLNAATLQHYWWLGNDIIRQQKEQGWGAKVIDQLSVDLQKRYGNDSGYSIRNLKYMKQFAEEYPDFPFVQVPLAQITWYHHISMLPKVKDMALRAFYMTETAIHGWSRDIMLMQICDNYHQKAQALPNNFSTTLPPVNSDLAKAVFKDPYNFGFVDMAQVKQEKDFRLHCYVAIELKAKEFKPEYLSKLNYYISAIDDLVKMPEDNPTIGLLLCRTKSNTKVEYALRGMTQPLGVAEYQTTKMIEELKSELPSIDDLERTLEK